MTIAGRRPFDLPISAKRLHDPVGTTLDHSCDVLVIGGGPAGSAISALLAQKGWAVTVLEKDHHPRFHIGESLLPLSIPFFERLGVLPQIEAIGLRKYAAEFHSMYHGKSSRFHFREALDSSFPYAFEVKRAEFDHVLIRNAAGKGAEVREGWRVTGVELKDDRIQGVTAVDGQGGEQRWTPRFVVDASGRDTFLASYFGIKSRNPKHNSAALYGHFRGAQRQCGQDEGNICIYWFDHGWFWMIPLKDDLMSVGAVCWPYYLKIRTVEVEQFFRDTLAQCPGVAARLADAELVSEVTATGNYAYQSSRMRGANYLLIGDAFAFIDPVFSSGVHLALNSAFEGADTVDGALRDPATAAARMARFDRTVRRGLETFSWFIYRITTPAIRDMVLHPRNPWRIKDAVISLLAGDLFRGTPVGPRLLVFKAIYYLKTLFGPQTSYAAYKRRRDNIAV
jgi:flavin-dependent dehydrogenase